MLVLNDDFFADFAEAWGALESEAQREIKARMVQLLKVDKGEGRKAQTLELLRQAGEHGMLVSELAEAMNTSAKNVSSQLSYLRKDGVKIGIRFDGRRYIEA